MSWKINHSTPAGAKQTPMDLIGNRSNRSEVVTPPAPGHSFFRNHILCLQDSQCVARTLLGHAWPISAIFGHGIWVSVSWVYAIESLKNSGSPRLHISCNGWNMSWSNPQILRISYCSSVVDGFSPSPKNMSHLHQSSQVWLKKQ